jgi:hypothetical protein
MARTRTDDGDEKELTVDDKFELLIAALTQRKDGGLSKDDLREILAETQKTAANAMQKALKPENETHPHISVFSYPEGDIAHPKGDLPFQFFYNAYPCHKFPETEHWREWELMKQVKPGEFTVVRKDGSVMGVSVKGEYDANQTLTKVSVEFPVSREEKWLVPPKSVVLYQLVYPDNPRKRFLEAMHEHLNLIMGDPVGATA